MAGRAVRFQSHRSYAAPIEFDSLWDIVGSADPDAVAMYLRHYSATRNRAKPRQQRSSSRRGGIAGTGDYLALMTPTRDALFVWKRYPGGVSRDGSQRGVNCSVFRNEGGTMSSHLVLDACWYAWDRWPGERLYTYVWAEKVRSVNPGYCFKVAGFKSCGLSKSGLVILERLPKKTP